MTSYMERWEEEEETQGHQQQHLHKTKKEKYRINNANAKASRISVIERDATVESPQHEDDDSFNLVPINVFPTSEISEKKQEKKQDMMMDIEFVDAAAFLKKNELGGDDSFSEDVEENWEYMNATGRPSDFFERKSRNLDHVELSSPRRIDDPMFQDNDAAADKSTVCKSEQRWSPTDTEQGVAIHDRFDCNLGLSGSGTAYSSGYEVHFDNSRLIYTPNSLRYLQEKSRLQRDSERHNTKRPDHTVADYSGEAEMMTRKAQSFSDQEILDDPSMDHVATLQRGPGVIKKAVHEVDAVVDNSIQSASSPPTKHPLGVELSDYMRDFVRDYELPLESMLPLSRTTDSWGEDTSVSQIDDDARRRSRDLGSSSSGIEPSGQTRNGVRRSRSQEISELDTIREVSCPSNTASQSQQSTGFHKSYSGALHSRTFNNLGSLKDEAHRRHADKVQNNFVEANESSDKPLSGETSKTRDDPKSRTASAALDQVQDKTTIQNPICDETSLSHSDRVGRKGSHGGASSSSVEDIDASKKRNPYSEARAKCETAQSHFETSQSDDVDPNSVRFCYRENGHQSRGATRKEHEDDQQQKHTDLKSSTTAVPKQLSVASGKLGVATTDTATIARRCRRFLCSVGEVMTEQIVFTNRTESVGRICVSLLPLSTGCQQFSVSPAVLELGPNTSSAFHVTFDARYVGAVSGIFQFRGVDIESLFNLHEVVIEASVKRHSESEASTSSKRGHQRSETDAVNERGQKLQTRLSAGQVVVTPSSIRFDCIRSTNGEKLFRKAKLCLVNNTTESLPFKICAPENLSVSPAFAMIQPASEISVSVLPMSRPVGQHRCGEIGSTNSSSRAEDWLSTLTVRVGKRYLHEVSVVVDRRVIQMLPTFGEIARSRHQLSSQTDSFYYTKRGKRRDLYFHARAVEFGCCNVGESHEVPVYVCNRSKAPMTVFLQNLQDPFSCSFSSTTIESKKFIEVMVTFTPKVVGKVSTSLFAYSLTDKAVVTLIARGT
ncbi:unnamed protein product [Peronospora belbahrii]|uniref:Cep192-like domain-containing protein n=1 Tax=Peronospora belbahrii TaxID=622444 RepID=A0AAU9L076_9STRA|nr:unnamed protein product [Peronospora belbahrii]